MPRVRDISKVVVAGALLAITACATRRDVVLAKGKGRGTERVYPVTVDQAWAISKTILTLEPTEKIEEHRDEGYMLTSDVITALTPGTYIGVFVEPAGAGETKVTFLARRRTPTQAYAALNDSNFHRKFAELVKLIAAAGPISTADGGSPPPDAPDAPAAPTGTDGGADGGS
jgi:hypothetical protein